MFNPDINEIYRYISLKKQMKEIEDSITAACKRFTYLHTEPKSPFKSWGLNDRNSLIIIHYTNEKEEDKELICSFDEIQTLMDDGGTHIKSLQ